MTAIRDADGPTANLVETYFRLANATPGACAWQRGNLRGCTGAFAHPICNFAVAMDLSDADVRELDQITGGREPFHTYLLPGGDRRRTDERLRQIGLRPTYRLLQMVGEPAHELPDLQPVEATTQAARLALAGFMVGQFFESQPAEFRDGIARATALAAGLDLYAVAYRGTVIASLMLCRDAATLGIYNLCVVPEHRGHGWGRGLLDWARAIAGTEGRTVTLQCDERLATWYRRAGFSERGEISAYTRSIGSTFDTM